ncbi:MAG: protein kinase [Oscillospiraceae bacterium]
MKKISELTRRSILDIIMDGFFAKELVDGDEVYELETDKYGRYIIRMPYCGRCDEISFLSRLYNLDELPSYDSRYRNARGDIIQHTVNNSDWDDYWVFSDGRFNLSNGSNDEPLLKFLCEILHPAVRIESNPWKEYLNKFNEILSPDGYELYATEGISGRDIYKYREKDVVVVDVNPTTRFAALKQIGEGSYATVLKFKDDFYNKTFALKRAKKELDEKELERFKREFEQMSKLHSPYIVEVYSYNAEKNEYTMEYMDFALEKYISKNNASMSVQQRKNIIIQLVRGYRYLHSVGIFHRDVSFKNVLLNVYDDALIVKISDFGLVKIPDSDLTSENSELKGCLNDPALKIKGFGAYELLDEIYALTLLFAYIITGKTNFAGIKEPCVRSFMEIGTNADRNKRYQNLDELQLGAIECLTALQK